MASGCIFIQNTYVLCGFTPKIARYSGFGGKPKSPTELTRETAIRETLEELFGIESSSEIIDRIVEATRDRPLIERDGYAIIVLSINDIEIFSSELIHLSLLSPYYKEIPTKFTDLISKRILCEKQEVTELKLIDMVSDEKKNNIDPELIKDYWFYVKNHKVDRQ